MSRDISPKLKYDAIRSRWLLFKCLNCNFSKAVLHIYSGYFTICLLLGGFNLAKDEPIIPYWKLDVIFWGWITYNLDCSPVGPPAEFKCRLAVLLILDCNSEFTPLEPAT